MRLVTYSYEGRTAIGAAVDGAVVDLGPVAPTMIDLLEAGQDGLDAVRGLIDSAAERLPFDAVRLQAPVRPRKFFAIGLNYADHVAESGLETPAHLTVFTKAPTSVCGPQDPIERPAVSAAIDYEGELGIVIGERCRHVRAEDADEVIAGYTIVNDVSVRDWQMLTPQWSLGKSFDTHGPIGPNIVTGDELGDPHDLDLRTYVNGELRQSSNTRHLIFSCRRIVEILSQACTLEPGDVIATGTPSGVAAGMEGRPWLLPGDVVRVEIDGIGAIENAVVDELVSADFVVDPSWAGPVPAGDQPEPTSKS